MIKNDKIVNFGLNMNSFYERRKILFILNIIIKKSGTGYFHKLLTMR